MENIVIKIEYGHPNKCDNCGKKPDEATVVFRDRDKDMVKMRLCQKCCEEVCAIALKLLER